MIKFLKKEDKASVYSILNGEISNISYVSTNNELENIFK